MTPPREIRIGLLGLGHVGGGVVQILRDHADSIEQRCGARLAVTRIAVRDPHRERSVDPAPARLEADWRRVVAADDVEIVVELVGGTGVAREAVLAAMAAGKPVVTANKALLAEHGEEIFAAAGEHQVDLAFEAAVGGGIPVIRTLREALASDRVDALTGIINGTCNFVLSEMGARGEPFAQAVRRAQELGYAEADPTFDLEGTDACQKLAILASLAFGGRVAPEEIPTEGITAIAPADLEYAAELGYTVKLLATARMTAGGLLAAVAPTLVPAGALLARVEGAFNAVAIDARALGPSLLVGQGAGPLPTGSAVVADLVEVARNLLLGTTGRVPHLAVHERYLRPLHVRSADELTGPYYLRFSVPDEPGVLARLAGALGAEGISIRALVQKQGQGHGGRPVHVAMLTHEARRGNLDRALDRIAAEGITRATTRRLPIAEGVLQ